LLLIVSGWYIYLSCALTYNKQLAAHVFIIVLITVFTAVVVFRICKKTAQNFDSADRGDLRSWCSHQPQQLPLPSPWPVFSPTTAITVAISMAGVLTDLSSCCIVL